MAIIKYRDVLRILKDVGGKEVSTRGSHQKWRLPNGQTVVLKVTHLNDDAGPHMLRCMKMAGINLPR
jgi:predicted RNA binding protein YcfA (HicA-like mRNA interferase family)